MWHLQEPEVVKKASALQAATVVGIMEDKAVRSEGGVTSRTETVRVSLMRPAPSGTARAELRMLEGGKPVPREPLTVRVGDEGMVRLSRDESEDEAQSA